MSRDDLGFKVGDDVLVVKQGITMNNHRISLKKVTVRAIWKNGTVVVDGHQRKFRADGSEIGGDVYHSRRLEPFTQERLDEYGKQVEVIRISGVLHRAAEHISQVARRDARVETFWESLTAEQKEMLERLGQEKDS